MGDSHHRPGARRRDHPPHPHPTAGEGMDAIRPLANPALRTFASTLALRPDLAQFSAQVSWAVLALGGLGGGGRGASMRVRQGDPAGCPLLRGRYSDLAMSSSATHRATL